jgi:hypothetical protein
MGGPPQELIVGRQVDRRQAHCGDLWVTHQIAHPIKARDLPVFQQQQERGLHFGFRRGRCQVQDSQIVSIRAGGLVAAERIVGAAEGEGREEGFAVAVMGKRPRASRTSDQIRCW